LFSWPELCSYEKILYLDTDIIIRRDIGNIFEGDIDTKLYGIPSGTLESPQFGGQFFDWPSCRLNYTTPGVNSGTLLFLNCEEIRLLFERINTHIDLHVSSGLKIPTVMDQPFINYHAFTSNMCNTILMKPYVSLYEDTLNVDNEDTASICHFSYPIGNFEHKYTRMSNFFKTLLTSLSSIDSSLAPDSQMNLCGRKYYWGMGYIQFGKINDTELTTTWGKGTWTVLDSHTISAIWNGYSHVVKFNSEFTEYISLRIYPLDFDCVMGKLV